MAKTCPARSGTLAVNVPVRGPCPSTSTCIPAGAATFTLTGAVLPHRTT
jgi:hypothetical protein